MTDVLLALDAQIEHYGAESLLAHAKEGFDTGKQATEQALGEAGQASTAFQPRPPKSYCAGGDWKAARSPSDIEAIQALAKEHDVPEEEAAGWYHNNTQLKNLDKQAAEYGLTAEFGDQLQRYASSCGAGSEGSSGFQKGNTCGGSEGVGTDDAVKKRTQLAIDSATHSTLNEQYPKSVGVVTEALDAFAKSPGRTAALSAINSIDPVVKALKRDLDIENSKSGFWGASKRKQKAASIQSAIDSLMDIQTNLHSISMTKT